jgi:predicted DNA-binding transcriptional regulator AlpA
MEMQMFYGKTISRKKRDMEQKYYDAKEVSKILNMSIPTVYRKVKSGDIPSIGKRPNIRFPKDAIDVMAEVEIEEEEAGLTFTPSTVADAWEKQEMNHAYESDDTVPFKTILEWRKRNDTISMNLKQDNKLLGWATFLPLEEEIALDLIYDRIRERDIPFQTIKKWTQPQLSVYIPIIEVVPSGNKDRDSEIGAYLIKKTIKWAISLAIQHDIKNWYTVGVTPEGQALAEVLGFSLLTSSDEGARKGYILEGALKPVKIVSQLIKDMDGSNSLLISDKEK